MQSFKKTSISSLFHNTATGLLPRNALIQNKYHASYDFYVCMPILPEQAPENAVTIPTCTALSLLCYGNYSSIDEAFLYLGE